MNFREAGLDESQAGIKIAGRNINNLRYADDATLMAESEELKSLSMKVKEQFFLYVTSSPINSAVFPLATLPSHQNQWPDISPVYLKHVHL